MRKTKRTPITKTAASIAQGRNRCDPGACSRDPPANNNSPAQIICLILTPQNDDGAQLKILADIAASFRHEHLREKTLQVGSYTEFLALIRSERRR
jgi:mannitol/fructose-specific phosphotransferase system IIA component (Ntr-type)